MIPKLNIKDFNYDLPDERIAKYPLAQRDSSKLLKYENGEISERVFRDLPEILPQDCSIVFNDTKVVPARLHFQKPTGAIIEVFCLEPVQPAEYVTSFAETSACTWKCIVGNAKKWKGELLSLYAPGDIRPGEGKADGNRSGEGKADGAEQGVSASLLAAMNLRAGLVERDGATSIVRFEWDGGLPFSQVLEACGKIPIPPYLNRETESIDLERYQTVYARWRGSVAAPTAGLHFTDSVREALKSKGMALETVCLHVGAGTFLPVKADDVAEHTMHREPFVVRLEFLERLLRRTHKVVAVGTTSVRTLESLYYAGVSCIETGEPRDVEQWAPYEREYPYSTEEAIAALVDYLRRKGLSELSIGTRIIIVPGFRFRIVDILVTNFHQPQSTLLLLISAFIGGEWRPIYDFALEHGFRFLSYGDSSVLFRQNAGH